MKIAIISCYKDPDFVRARVLRAGLAANPQVELTIIKNKYTNWLRYPEVLFRLSWLRFRLQPVAYIVTFRGYEILPFVQLIAGSKPVIFDELINLIEYVVYEHHILQPRHEPARLLASWYSRVLRRCEFILADTTAHAAYSAALSGISNSLYRTIPVGTDEQTIPLIGTRKVKKSDHRFEIVFIGNMKPLYGLEYVLKAAMKLVDRQEIRFLIVGGSRKTAQEVQIAVANGAHVSYKSWIPFEKLPQTFRQADLGLAGPFGNTEQSRLVITAKTYQMLACAVPTVIGRSPATSVFTDMENCLTVPQGDEQALTNKIIWAYENRKKLEAIGQCGRKLYDKKFSNRVIQDRLKKLVLELKVNDT